MSKNVPYVVIAVLLALLTFGSCRESAKEALARAAEARADSLAEVVAEQAERNAALTDQVNALDSLYATASVQWDVERRDLAAQISRARQRTTVLGDDLRPRLDSISAVLFAEYEARIEEERAADALVHETYEAQIVALETRDAAKDELIAGLRAEIAPLRAEVAELRQANDLLHAQIGSMKRTSWLWKAGAAAEAAVILVSAVRGS